MLKRWVPASFIAIAMALALAGGAVLAVGHGSGLDRTDVFERAAVILGVESADLQAAHDQARREALDARIAGSIDMLVAAEIINQTEADSFTAWVADRPDSADDVLLNQLTSSLTGSPWMMGIGRFQLHNRLAPSAPDELTTRMAEILGLNPMDLADALNDGKNEFAELGRLAKLHAVVDSMLEKEIIDSSEAEELHAWIDATPEWLLILDVPSRALPSFGLLEGKFDGSGFLNGLPFGDRNHFGDGDREFRFQFRGPEGTFKFGPEGGDFPFDDERLQELFEGFDLERLEGLGGFEGLGDLDGLFERFRGHRFFEPHSDELVPPTVTPDPETTSA